MTSMEVALLLKNLQLEHDNGLLKQALSKSPISAISQSSNGHILAVNTPRGEFVNREYLIEWLTIANLVNQTVKIIHFFATIAEGNRREIGIKEQQGTLDMLLRRYRNFLSKYGIDPDQEPTFLKLQVDIDSYEKAIAEAVNQKHYDPLIELAANFNNELHHTLLLHLTEIPTRGVKQAEAVNWLCEKIEIIQSKHQTLHGKPAKWKTDIIPHLLELLDYETGDWVNGERYNLIQALQDHTILKARYNQGKKIRRG